MTELYFDPEARLLIFPCRVEYKHIRRVWLALDTGSSFTIIRDSVLRDIGYSLETITKFVTFGDASATHFVPKVILKSISLADARVESVEALCYTIPEEHGIDGVIGLNFLRHFNISFNFEHGTLTFNRFD